MTNESSDATAENLNSKDGVPFHGAPSAHYLKPKKRALLSVPTMSLSSDPFHLKIGESMRHLVSQSAYPCIAAIRSISTDNFRVGAYEDDLGSDEVTEALAMDLSFFIKEQKNNNSPYFSFLAVFHGPSLVSEEEFESLLWRQLQRLHDKTQRGVAWDPRVSANTGSMEFCFSFQGEGVFVVGMHPNSSRLSRVYPFPTLVFNLYQQFEALKSEGIYEPMKTTNRQRDLKFQGSLNPMLTRFGESAEAVQYSGRDVGSKWQCPFRHGHTEENM